MNTQKNQQTPAQVVNQPDPEVAKETIQDKIVSERGLEPDAIFYIRDKKIEKK